MADPLSVAGSVVGIISLSLQVTQSLYDYYASVTSQHSDVAHVARKLKNLSELIECLHSELNSRTFRADEKDLLNKIERAVQECEEYIQELKQEAEKFEKTPPDSLGAAFKATGRRVAYPFRQSTLIKLEEDIRELVDQLSLALQLLQQKVIDHVQDDVEDIKAVVELIRASQISSKIHAWLKAPDATIEFNEACKKKHAGTGLWFVKSPSFLDWLEHEHPNHPNPFLWLQGFAGCGKSVLSSTAIQYTLRYRRSNPQIGIAFFYFTFNNKDKQDASAMLRALVLQLSGQLGDSPPALVQLHQRYRNATPPDQALLDCLHQLVRAFRHVYILLDALDESPRGKLREAVLDIINDIRAWQEPDLHILVTSRDEVDIREGLPATTEETIQMRNYGIDGDIALFVSQHLRHNRRLRKWQDYYEMIEQVLIEKANGVFRWVECQFAALAYCPESEDLLEHLLASLPQTLDETYRQMLQNIPPLSKDYAWQMLTVLCCATRPLTIPELIDAIAIEIGQEAKFNPKRRLKNANALQEACPGFTEVDMDDRNNETTIRIAHFSVQEYLESDRIREHEEVASYGVRKQDANTLIADICLTLLLEPQVVTLDFRDIRHQYPLAQYAARQWPHHFRESSQAQHVEEQMIRLLQDTEGACRRWVQLEVRHIVQHNGENEEIPTPFYFVSEFGFVSALTKLCNDYCSTTSQTLPDVLNSGPPLLGTALQTASSNGHEEIVQLLLEKGADVNAKGGKWYGTALQAASAKGHQEIIQLLLNNGADINAQGGYYDTALQAASYKGHQEIVQLLLNNGADINAQGGYYDTALQAASTEGHQEIIQLLLNKGANINAKGGKWYGTALQAALIKGHQEIVQLLLDKGADVNAQGGYYDTALQAASYKGYQKIIQLLLKKGADINAQGEDDTALQVTSAKGHQEIVQLLLDHGAEAYTDSE